jgi:predicted RecA/RadA family phage recombinase
MAYNDIQTSDAPSQRKFNGDYGFPFVATADEVNAGTVIIRGKLIGVSHRNVEAGQYGTAELQGTVTINKDAATEFDQGDIVYWDVAEKLAVSAAGTGIVKLGICKLAPSANALTVDVLTNAVSNA